LFIIVLEALSMTGLYLYWFISWDNLDSANYKSLDYIS